MKTQNSGIIFVVVLLLFGATFVSTSTAASSEKPTTLKDAYKDFFKIGVAVNRQQIMSATGGGAGQRGGGRSARNGCPSARLLRSPFEVAANRRRVNRSRPVLLGSLFDSLRHPPLSAPTIRQV